MPQTWQHVLGTIQHPGSSNQESPGPATAPCVDLLNRPEDDPEVQTARAEMLAHPQVQALAAQAATWGDRPLKRHNDASHPIYAFSTLADFGVQARRRWGPRRHGCRHRGRAGPSVARAAPSKPCSISPLALAGGERTPGPGCFAMRRRCSTRCWPWAWETMRACRRPWTTWSALVDENGWRCVAAPELGRFRGPGPQGRSLPHRQRLRPEGPGAGAGVCSKPRHARRRGDAALALGDPGGAQDVPLWHRHRLSQAQVPLCLVQYPARDRRAQPISLCPRRRPLPARWWRRSPPRPDRRPLHRRLDVPRLEGLVVCWKKRTLALAHLPLLPNTEAYPA